MSSCYLCFIISILFCICLPNFVKIGPSAVESWRHSDFQDGGRQPYWIFSRVTADHPRSANEGLSLVRKFRLDRIYSFGDIAIFMWSGFGLKCLFTWLYSPRMQSRWKDPRSPRSRASRMLRGLMLRDLALLLVNRLKTHFSWMCGLCALKRAPTVSIFQPKMH